MKNLFKKNKDSFFDLPTKKSSFISDEMEWPEDSLSEGELLVDVYQNSENIIIKSTISGVRPENLMISLDRDILTIKGKRDFQGLEDAECLLRECYWGSFSRTIILPDEVDSKKMDADLENGVLTIVLKKINKEHHVKVKIKS